MMRRLINPELIKPPLFRFTTRKWANIFMRTGQIRLGTIYEYAMKNSLGKARFDILEGCCILNAPLEGGSQQPVKQMILARNNLNLCMSHRYEEYMHDEFESDCCIVIDDMRFFECIDRQIESKYKDPLIRKTIYMDKTTWAEVPNKMDFAGIMKDKPFSETERGKDTLGTNKTTHK